MRSTVGGLTALQSTNTGLLLLAVSAGREPLRQRDRVAGAGWTDEIGRRDLLVAGGHHAGGLARALVSALRPLSEVSASRP